jgi:hypothetical protein
MKMMIDAKKIMLIARECVSGLLHTHLTLLLPI